MVEVILCMIQVEIGRSGERSAGVSQPSVLRERAVSSWATCSRSSMLQADKSVLYGKYRRSSPSSRLDRRGLPPRYGRRAGARTAHTGSCAPPALRGQPSHLIVSERGHRTEDECRVVLAPSAQYVVDDWYEKRLGSARAGASGRESRLWTSPDEGC